MASGVSAIGRLLAAFAPAVVGVLEEDEAPHAPRPEPRPRPPLIVPRPPLGALKAPPRAARGFAPGGGGVADEPPKKELIEAELDLDERPDGTGAGSASRFLIT